MRRVWTVVVIGLLVVLSACGSSASPDSEPVATSQDAAQDTPALDTAASEAPADEETVSEAFVSPINEALGFAQDEFASAFDTYVREAEELVQVCMAEAGFDYTPTPSGLDQATRRNFELRESLTEEQFTEQYGFGVSTLFELNFEGQGVIDFVNQQFGPPPTAARSEGETAAYEMALNGQTTQGLSPEDAQEELFSSQGALDGSCRATAYEAADNPGSVYDGLFSLLGDELESLDERIDNDQRIRDATADWQTCMAAEGHAYEDPSEIFAELQDQANDLGNQFLASPTVLTALGQAQQEDFVNMSADDRAAFLERIGATQGFAWVPEVQTEFDKLIAFELQVAADSADCADSDLFQQVRFEYETEFVETHADQLALIAAGES